MEKSNDKNQQLLEWTLCTDEHSWESSQQVLMASANNTSSPQASLHNTWHYYRLHFMGALLTLAILAVYAGWWGWQRAQVGLAAVESELEAEIVAELWRGGKCSMPATAAEAQGVGIMKLPSDPSEIVTELEIRDLGKDWAQVEVTLQPTADGPYRQTRVYLDSERGWVQVEPTAAHWGARRQLESRYFVFAYHTTDEEAVMQAAPQLDALYAEMHAYLYGPKFAAEMLTITIDPAHSGAERQMPSGIVVASPAVALLPADVATSEVLLQALVLGLYEHLATHAFTANVISGQRFRLQNALRLWLIWEYKLPLEVWREPLVQWIFEAPNDAQRRDPNEVPAFADDLCAHHELWGRYPLDVAVPIQCWQNRDGEEQFMVWRYESTIPAISLGSLLYSSIANVYDESATSLMPLPEPGPSAIVLATLFEYVTATYGRDKVQVLLAAIPQHRRAETLMPAVFGVSANEFQANWRAYLAEKYALEDVP